MLTDQEQEGLVVFLLVNIAPAAVGMACAVLALPVEEALIDRVIVVLRPLGKILVVLVQSNPEELSPLCGLKVLSAVIFPKMMSCSSLV